MSGKSPAERVGGVILAGGKARRMGGGDKCLRVLSGETLLQKIINRVAPQTEKLILNANGNLDRFKGFQLPTVSDVIEGSLGPLVGILTGMEWMQNNYCDMEWLASFPADAPFIPNNFVEQCLLVNKHKQAEIICARSGGRTHPVCSLWRISLASKLRFALEKQGTRKIDLWTSSYSVNYVDFEIKRIDPFFNINRERDLQKAAELFINGS